MEQVFESLESQISIVIELLKKKDIDGCCDYLTHINSIYGHTDETKSCIPIIEKKLNFLLENENINF
jgi:hypothetical protein